MLLQIKSIKIRNRTNWQLSLAIVIVCMLIPTFKANAAPTGVELFSVNSPSNKLGKKTAAPAAGDHIPVISWFEKFDDLREKYHPSDADKVILTRPLMQEAERVQQWTNTASKISKNYALLSKAIRNLPSLTAAPDVKEYRDLMADWYQDASGVYAELIRPRPPAHTIEDLQEQLEVVKKRSESLADNIASLKAMDRTLRQQYDVHPAIQDDVIQQFVRSK